jgi:hypothetical protein
MRFLSAFCSGDGVISCVYNTNVRAAAYFIIQLEAPARQYEGLHTDHSLRIGGTTFGVRSRN